MTDDPWLTEKEAATELRVSQGTVRRERIEGRLGYVNVRRRVFYPMSQIQAYKLSLVKKCPNTSSASVPNRHAGTLSGPKDAVAFAVQQAQKISKSLNSSSRRSS